MSPEPSSADDLARHLEELERSLLSPNIRRSPETLERLLAQEFVEFGSSGRCLTRSEIIRELASELPATYSVSEFVVRFATAEAAIVTYRLTTTGQAGRTRESLRSSFWGRRDGRWQIVFHQGTRSA